MFCYFTTPSVFLGQRSMAGQQSPPRFPGERPSHSAALLWRSTAFLLNCHLWMRRWAFSPLRMSFRIVRGVLRRFQARARQKPSFRCIMIEIYLTQPLAVSGVPSWWALPAAQAMSSLRRLQSQHQRLQAVNCHSSNFIHRTRQPNPRHVSNPVLLSDAHHLEIGQVQLTPRPSSKSRTRSHLLFQRLWIVADLHRHIHLALDRVHC